MKFLKIAILSLALAVSAWAAEANVVTKEATGQAAITAGDEKAYEEAKNNALRTAVEEAAGVLLQADTLTLNSQLVQDRVFANTTGYVKKFEILEKKKDKGVVTVKVKADVGTAELDKDLQAVKGIIARLGRNKLIVVIQEQAVDDKGNVTKGELLATILTDQFKKDGWKLIDEKGTGAGTSESIKISSGSGIGILDAKEIAKKTDADYIVYGTVNFRYIPPSGGGLIPEKNEKGEQLLFLVTGEYDLSMFETRTGAQLAKVAGKFDQTNMQSKGKIQAGKSYAQTAHDYCKADSPRITGELRNPVLEYLRDKDLNGWEVSMTVSGLADFTAADDFSKSLQSLKNVKSVKAGDFDKGKASYEVSFLGNANDLARAVGAATFKKKKLKVEGVKNNTVEVSVAK